MPSSKQTHNRKFNYDSPNIVVRDAVTFTYLVPFPCTQIMRAPGTRNFKMNNKSGNLIARAALIVLFHEMQ